MKPVMIAVIVLVALSAVSVQGQFGERKANDRTITKVVKLLRSMLEKSQKDGDEEEHVWTKFKCFCDDVQSEKNTEGASLKKEIDLVEARLETLTGTIGQSQQQTAIFKKMKKDNLNAIEEARRNYEKEKKFTRDQIDEYERVTYQLEKAIEALAAIGNNQKFHKDHSQFMGKGGASLIAEKLRALTPIMDKSQHDAVTSFLEAPFTGTYTQQSGQIFELLQGLKRRYYQKLKDMDTHIQQSKEEYQKIDEVLTAENNKLSDKIEDHQETEADAQKATAVSKKLRVQLSQEYKEVLALLDTLVPTCREKEKSYNTRKVLRANEEAAITEAISILSSDAAFAAFGDTKATSGSAQPKGFNFNSDTTDTADTTTDTAKFLQIQSRDESSFHEEATSVLKEAASTTDSTRLHTVVAAMEADNPFKAVTEQIAEMIDLIHAESRSDERQRQECEVQDRKFRDQYKMQERRLHTQHRSLQDTKVDIRITKKNLADAEEILAFERKTMTDLTAARVKENLAYQTNIANLQEAETILGKAVKVLKTYYDDLEAKIKDGQAGLLQKSQHNVKKAKQTPEELYAAKAGSAQTKYINEASSAAWTGDYTGQKDDGGDAVTLLKYLLDTTRSQEKDAHDAELKAQHKHEDVMQKSKDEEAKTEKDLKQYQETLAELQEDHQDMSEEFDSQVEQQDKTTEAAKQNRADCEFIVKNIDTRKTNRQIELDALKRADRMIRKTPAYKDAVTAARVESYGKCKDKCMQEKASYQYYKFTPVRTRSSNSNSVQIADFYFKSEGQWIDTKGKGFEVSNPGGRSPRSERPEKIFDENSRTKWLDFNKKALVINFKKATHVDQFRFITANDAPGRDPVSWTLEGSENGRDWTPLLKGSGKCPTKRYSATKWYSIVPPKADQHVKCLACMADVTVVGYCTSHSDKNVLGCPKKR